MHKVKRKRFLQKQKKKKRKDLRRKAHLTVSSVQVLAASVPERRFKRADKYVGCNDAMMTYFAPASGNYYRIVHNPPEHNDELVQSEQVFEGLAPSMSNIPDTIAPGSSLEEQFEHIAAYALSFGVDDEQLAAKYWREYGKRKNDSQRSNFVRRKGDVMGLYHLLPEAGMMQKTPDEYGHAVLAEYDDFELERYRVKEFGLKPLTDYKHEEE